MSASGSGKVVGLLGLLVAGCGDPLVGGDYEGEPLLTLRGEIIVNEALGADVHPGVAVLWATPEASSPLVEPAVEVITWFPSRYELSLYLPPSDDVIFESPLNGKKNALGAPVVFLDDDDDGQFTVGEERVAGASGASLLIWEDEEAAYHVYRLDQDGCPTGVRASGDDEGEASVELLIGDPCGRLPDIQCDGDDTEWGAACAEDTG